MTFNSRPQRGSLHSPSIRSQLIRCFRWARFEGDCTHHLGKFPSQTRQLELCHRYIMANHQTGSRLRCRKLESDNVCAMVSIFLNLQSVCSFDTWEEVSSSSFFTTAVQHRSLRQGIDLADAIGQSSSASAYPTQASNLLCFLQVNNFPFLLSVSEHSLVVLEQCWIYYRQHRRW